LVTVAVKKTLTSTEPTSQRKPPGSAVVGIIDKTRYPIGHGGYIWEIDWFHGANHGLVIAEIELVSEEEHFERPVWLGREVSANPRYLNFSPSRHPFS